MQNFEPSSILLKKRTAWISLVVGIGMFLSKFSAYFLTGSTAIFSDAAESVVHVVATSMALYSIYLSSKPADESHLYGHGNIEYFSAGFEGLLIILAAITIIYTSVDDILYGVTTQRLGIGTAIIGGAGIVNLILGLFLLKKGKETNSLTLIADGKHVLTDSFTSIGVVIGLILVLVTGYLLIDPLIAMVVALNILFTGYKLIRESIGGLMNETDKKTLENILKLLRDNRKIYWIDIHHLRFWKSGEYMYVDFHLILPYYFSIKQSHLEEEYVEKYLLALHPFTSVRIHMNYCKDIVCKFCDYSECEFRREEKRIDFEWDTEKFLGDPIYNVIKET